MNQQASSTLVDMEAGLISRPSAINPGSAVSPGLLPSCRVMGQEQGPRDSQQGAFDSNRPKRGLSVMEAASRPSPAEFSQNDSSGALDAMELGALAGLRQGAQPCKSTDTGSEGDPRSGMQDDRGYSSPKAVKRASWTLAKPVAAAAAGPSTDRDDSTLVAPGHQSVALAVRGSGIPSSSDQKDQAPAMHVQARSDLDPVQNGTSGSSRLDSPGK